jgi:hypothetical protein
MTPVGGSPRDEEAIGLEELPALRAHACACPCDPIRRAADRAEDRHDGAALDLER